MSNGIVQRRVSCCCCCWWIVLVLVLALECLVVTHAQDGRRDQFLIRVLDENGTGRLSFNFGEFGLQTAADNVDIATLGAAANGGTGAGVEALDLPAPDVVVGDLSLLQRNNLVAAAGNVQTPAPTQRIRTAMNSGLRRRRNSDYNNNNGAY